MSKEKQKRADGFEQIEEATISTEQFIEKNQKLLVRGVLVIIIVVGAILGYYRFYKTPMKEEALKQMFVNGSLQKFFLLLLPFQIESILSVICISFLR